MVTLLYIHSYESSFNPFLLLLNHSVMRQQTTYLMQFSGSPSQSVLHLNRSQDNHPIGGVRAKPFSKAVTFGTVTVNTSNPNARQKTVDRDITALLGIILILFCLSWSKGKVDLKVKERH